MMKTIDDDQIKNRIEERKCKYNVLIKEKDMLDSYGNTFAQSNPAETGDLLPEIKEIIK